MINFLNVFSRSRFAPFFSPNFVTLSCEDMAELLPVVVVTGASSGIGAAVATLLLKSGKFRVALLARREAELQAVAAQAGGVLNQSALVIPTDVTVKAQIDAAADAVLKAWGRIDVWINNAGKGIFKKTSELTAADLDEQMVINVHSALYGMQAALAAFRASASRAGQIINVSSLLGRNPTIAHQRSAYCGAKHFLNAITATFRAELKESDPHVVVSLVSPGVVATEFGVNAKGPDSRAFGNAQPPEDVAAVIVRVISSHELDTYTAPFHYKFVTDYQTSLAAPPAQPAAAAPAA